MAFGVVIQKIIQHTRGCTDGTDLGNGVFVHLEGDLSHAETTDLKYTLMFKPDSTNSAATMTVVVI